MEYVKITVPNWQKWQPRVNDPTVQSMSWLKLHFRIIDHAIWDLSPSAVKLFLTCLCLVGRDGFKTGSITISLKKLQVHAQLRPSRIRVDAELIQVRQTMLFDFGTLEEINHRNPEKPSTQEYRKRIRKDLTKKILLDSYSGNLPSDLSYSEREDRLQVLRAQLAGIPQGDS